MKVPIFSDDASAFVASLNGVPACRRRVADTDWFPAVNVSETGEEYLFEFDLPGLTRDQIQVHCGGDALCLTGVRTLRHGGKILRAERPAGAFMRRVVLPADCRCSDIHASLEDGVLQLRLPKQSAPEANSERRNSRPKEPELTAHR